MYMIYYQALKKLLARVAHAHRGKSFLNCHNLTTVIP